MPFLFLVGSIRRKAIRLNVVAKKGLNTTFSGTKKEFKKT